MCVLNDTKISCIKEILKTVKSVEITDCFLGGDIYENVLKYCENLKQLHVNGNTNDNFVVNNGWQQWKYPIVEHLVLESYAGPIVVHLIEFFSLNGHVRKFSTDSSVLRFYDLLIPLNLKFGIFALKLTLVNDMESTCKKLNVLFRNHFYAKLHFYMDENYEITQETVHRLSSVQSLEKLCGKLAEPVQLSALVNLVELFVDDSDKVIDWVFLASNLLHLQRVGFLRSSIDHISTLISKTVKLRQIMAYSVQNGTHFQDTFLDIFALNTQRKSLHAARNVTIYLNENIYIAIKAC